MDSYTNNGSIAEDLQVSFKAAGIFPFNKFKLIE